MLGVEIRAKKLSWMEVTEAIQAQLADIFGEPLNCTAAPDDTSYWDAQFQKPGLSLAQITTLLNCVGAGDSMRLESLPCSQDKVAFTTSIGMHLAEALLKRHLQAEWDVQFICRDYLCLIGLKEMPIMPEEPVLQLGDKRINFSELKSREDLLSYLQENGATHASLMDFCEPYLERFGNELCWPYPISDGKHSGTFLVLVRDGILSLPYDEMEKETYELFCVEDAAMFRYSEEMQIFIDDWHFFDTDLRQAMHAMKQYLKEQEEVHNEED